MFSAVLDWDLDDGYYLDDFIRPTEENSGKPPSIEVRMLFE